MATTLNSVISNSPHELIERALRTASRRVVVKRPKQADHTYLSDTLAASLESVAFLICTAPSLQQLAHAHHKQSTNTTQPKDTLDPLVRTVLTVMIKKTDNCYAAAAASNDLKRSSLLPANYCQHFADHTVT